PRLLHQSLATHCATIAQRFSAPGRHRYASFPQSLCAASVQACGQHRRVLCRQSLGTACRCFAQFAMLHREVLHSDCGPPLVKPVDNLSMRLSAKELPTACVVADQAKAQISDCITHSDAVPSP